MTAQDRALADVELKTELPKLQYMGTEPHSFRKITGSIPKVYRRNTRAGFHELPIVMTLAPHAAGMKFQFPTSITANIDMRTFVLYLCRDVV